MSADRRLAKLESALSPKTAVLLWLTEAHAFPALPAYVGWLMDQPKSVAPLARIPEQVEAAVRASLRGASLRGAPRTSVEPAVARAVKEAIFLFELVLALNLAAEETIRFEGPRSAALYWQGRALALDAALDGGAIAKRAGEKGRPAERPAAWREVARAQLTDLYTAEAGRGLLERRWLDGQRVLFPELAGEWESLRYRSERLVALGDGPATLAGGARRRKRPSTDPLAACRAATRVRAPAWASELADRARSASLELLGDTAGAVAIVERWWRAPPRSRPSGSCRVSNSTGVSMPSASASSTRVRQQLAGSMGPAEIACQTTCQGHAV